MSTPDAPAAVVALTTADATSSTSSPTPSPSPLRRDEYLKNAKSAGISNTLLQQIAALPEDTVDYDSVVAINRTSSTAAEDAGLASVALIKVSESGSTLTGKSMMSDGEILHFARVLNDGSGIEVEGAKILQFNAASKGYQFSVKRAHLKVQKDIQHLEKLLVELPAALAKNEAEHAAKLAELDRLKTAPSSGSVLKSDSPANGNAGQSDLLTHLGTLAYEANVLKHKIEQTKTQLSELKSQPAPSLDKKLFTRHSIQTLLHIKWGFFHHEGALYQLIQTQSKVVPYFRETIHPNQLALEHKKQEIEQRQKLDAIIHPLDVTLPLALAEDGKNIPGGLNPTTSAPSDTSTSVERNDILITTTEVIPSTHADSLWQICREIHAGVLCDGCQQCPLIGARMKCSVCNDYDLCEDCISKKVETLQHKTDHAMVKVLKRSN